MTSHGLKDRNSVDRRQTGLLFVVVVVILVGTFALMLSRQDPADLVDVSSSTDPPETSLSIAGRLSPSLTFDGSKLAMVGRTELRGDFEILVRDMIDGTEFSLVDHPGDEARPAWSPDGERIAFVRFGDGRLRTVVRDMESGRETVLWSMELEGRIDPRTVPKIAWRPDGTAVVLPSRREDGTVGLSMFELTTGKSARITNPPEPTSRDLDPSFAPDGSAIAFTRYRNESDSDLFVVTLSGEIRQLTFDHRNVFGHAWSPDSERIVFSSNRSGYVELWSIAASGGNPSLVEGIGIGARDPSIDASGLLAFERWNLDTEIWSVTASDPEQNTPRVRLSGPGWDGAANYSPNGLRLAFISANRSAAEVRVATASGTSVRILTSIPKEILDAPSWSPDGRRIAFHQRVDGRMSIMVVLNDGAEMIALTDDQGDDMLPTWSRGGDFIYFGSNRSGRWEIWRASSERGEPSRVTHSGGFRALFSTDGRTLLYTKFGKKGIWSLREGIPERFLTDELSPEDAANWVVLGDVIWFISRSSSGARVLELPLGGVGRYERSGSFLPCRSHTMPGSPSRLTRVRSSGRQSMPVKAQSSLLISSENDERR